MRETLNSQYLGNGVSKMFAVYQAIARRLLAYYRFLLVVFRELVSGRFVIRTPIAGTGRHSLHFAGKSVQLCRGIGVEIGALHKRLPLIANVLYLDVRPTAELRKLYQGDARVSGIGHVQLVAQGALYPFIDDDAFDFVASSHVLEHTPNPPRQIQEWLRIVRTGGIVYIIVPDKRYCFDRRREITPLDHFVKEFDANTSTVALDHYRDYIVNTEGEDGLVRDVSDAAIEDWYRQQKSIHVHTFTAASFKLCLEAFADKLSYEIVHFKADELNIHAALRKR